MEKWSNEAFAGYLAAMIDGEGNIDITSDYSVRVRIANTVRPTLAAIVDRLGFGRVTEYVRPKDSKYKRLFCAEISSVKHVDLLFEVCGPFIHMKRDQMERALIVVRRVLGAGAILDERNRSILAEIKTGRVQKQIAANFGVSEQLISRIKRGHTWSSVISASRDRALRRNNPRSLDQSFRLHGAPL